ncbi:MAG: group 1 truncated hemoglobin [Kofleriaceae bacterium]
MRKLFFVALLAFASTSAYADGAKKADPKTAPAEKSLFDRLGGKAAITKVVDDFVANVAADKRINSFFAKTDIKKLKANLVDQVCEATGGPCKYKGKDMKTAHKGMKITEDQWNATVEDLTKALDKNKVGDKEKGELLGALGGMKGDIVGQ